MMNKKVLIFGAGAIGRGFLAPLLQSCNYQISFVDKDKEIIRRLKNRQTYKVAVTQNKKYEFQEIKINDVISYGSVGIDNSLPKRTSSSI